MREPGGEPGGGGGGEGDGGLKDPVFEVPLWSEVQTQLILSLQDFIISQQSSLPDTPEHNTVASRVSCQSDRKCLFLGTSARVPPSLWIFYC